MRRFCAYKNGKTWTWRRRIVALLALVVVTSTSMGMLVPSAQAELPTIPADSGTNYYTTVEQTLGTGANISSEYYDAQDQNKEMVLDGIAWSVAKLAIQEIAKSTVRWINSGFDGSPAFATDLKAYLKDQADQVARDFIHGTGLDVLYSPFQLNIRIALQLQYQAQTAKGGSGMMRCTLGDIVDNVDGFLKGDFVEKGMQGWFAVTVNPNNNFFGATAAAQAGLSSKLAAEKEKNLNTLLWGQGFLGKEECVEVEVDGDEDTVVLETQCSVVTPGETIANALDESLTAGMQGLITADEINEIIAALFGQLAQKALEAEGGLFGMNRKSGDSDTPFIDQVGNPKFDTIPGKNTIGDNIILKAIKSEQEYHDLWAGVVSKASTTIARSEELEELVKNEEDDVIWECNMSTVQQVVVQVSKIRADALKRQEESAKNLATLKDLQARYEAATKDALHSIEAAQARLRVLEEFSALQGSGVLHTDSDVTRSKILIEGLRLEDSDWIPNPPPDSPVPINERLARLAAELESACRSRPKDDDSPGDSDSD